MFTTPECIKTPVDLVKLWLHEASRVYGDKLIETKDMETFQKMKLDIAKAGFEVSQAINDNDKGGILIVLQSDHHKF